MGSGALEKHILPVHTTTTTVGTVHAAAYDIWSTPKGIAHSIGNGCSSIHFPDPFSYFLPDTQW